MESPAAIPYRRLPGRTPWFRFGGVSAPSTSLWLGPDHLLKVERSASRESYKRFYYRDIQAVVVETSSRRSTVNLFNAAVLVVILLITGAASSFSAAGMLTALPFALPFIAGLIINSALGPSVQAVLVTAVGTEPFSCFSRLDRSTQALGWLTTEVTKVQGEISSAQLALKWPAVLRRPAARPRSLSHGSRAPTLSAAPAARGRGALPVLPRIFLSRVRDRARGALRLRVVPAQADRRPRREKNRAHRADGRVCRRPLLRCARPALAGFLFGGPLPGAGPFDLSRRNDVGGKAEMTPARPALELLEEAVHLLRMSPARIHALYFAGTIPFLLGFLYFWTEMSRNVRAEDQLVEWSLAMALLFIWMKCWQSAAASELLAHCARAQRLPWTWARIRRLIYLQGTWQPTKLIGLPIAALLTMPFAWTCAFYHQLAMFGDGTAEPAVAYRRAKEVAGLWPGQNFKAILLINVFGLFVFLNIYILGAMLPELIRMFSGVESAFSMSPAAFILNTSFFGAALAAAHLCLNPLTMAFYVVRCFHARSVRDGRDLLAALAEERNKEEGGRKNSLSPMANAARAVFLIFSFLLVPCSLCRAEEVAAPAAPPARIAPAAIDRSLKETFEHREFAWRMPRDAAGPKAEKPKGPIAQFFDGIGAFASRVTKKIGQWISDVREWWRRATNFGPGRAPSPGGVGLGLGVFSAAEVLLYFLLAASLLVAVYVAFRQWRSRRVSPVAVAGVSPPENIAVDLQTEDVLASQLPEDEWLRLARDLAARGEYRLALRALFLGTLAGLASQGVISIARHKSNRDYQAEVFRRAHQHPNWPPAFGGCVVLFERSWYGQHVADSELLAEFERQQHPLLAPPPPPPLQPAGATS